MRLLAGGLLFLLAMPPLLRAQDSVIVIDPDLPPGDSSVVRAGPPSDVVSELLAFYNDSATTRVQGDVSFPAGSMFAGRLAIFRGSLRLAGRVRGDVVVVNATLYLLPGADVEGDVLVVGGRLIRSPGARHVGRERVLWDAAPVLRNPDGALVLRERRRPLGELATARASFRTGRIRTDLLLATGGTYNRIEGLPIVFGPTFELRPSRRTLARLDLRGILRTAGEGSRLSSDFGYSARAELALPDGRHRRTDLQRGRAVRGAAALGRRERLVGLPAPAGLPRLVRAARGRRRGLGAAHPVAALRALASGGITRAACGPSIPGRCSGTAIAGAAIRSATTATTSPPAPSSTSTPATTASTPPPAGCSARGTSTAPATTWRR